MTGTNGKTTTTELLGAIAREAGLDVAVAGNVGTPLSSLVGAVDPGAVVVCECSSFQLEDSSAFAPECALLLNVEPDHLDRHGTFEAYRDAKLRVVREPGPGRRGGAAGRVRAARRAARRRRRSARDGDLAHRDGTLLWRGEPLIGAERDPPARRPQPRERDGARPRRRSRAAGPPRPCRAP